MSGLCPNIGSMIGRIAVAMVPPLFVSSFLNTLPQLFLFWPGRASLPVILKRKGFLEGDLYAEAAETTSQIVANTVLSSVMPANQLLIIVFFNLGNWIVWSAAIALTCLFLLRISSSLWVQDGKNTRPLSKVNIFVTSSFLTLAGVSVLQNESFDNFWTQSLFGARYAHWSPFELVGLNPGGLSILFALVSILFYVSIYDAVEVVAKRPFKFSTVILSALISGLLHPTASLFFFAFLGAWVFGVWGFRWRGATKTFMLLSLSYSSGALATQILAGGFQSSSGSLYEIYVLQRHPHHYHVETYIGELLIFLPLNLLVLLALFFSNRFLGFTPSRAGARVAFLILLLFFIGHLAQWISNVFPALNFVSVIGLSRISPALNLLVLTTWISVILGVVQVILAKVLSSSRLDRTPIIAAAPFLLIVALTGSLIHSSLIQHNRLSSEIVRIEKMTDLQISGELLVVGASGGRTKIPWREFASVAVYWDHYFPFEEGAAEEWSARALVVQSLQTCSQGKSLQLCLDSFQGVRQSGLDPIVFSETDNLLCAKDIGIGRYKCFRTTAR